MFLTNLQLHYETINKLFGLKSTKSDEKWQLFELIVVVNFAKFETTIIIVEKFQIYLFYKKKNIY